ncbi:MAG: hypothetical protein KGS72_10285 [Cyanobacteria bacterium REEB67]|nr:hypothetical protein [Cyanobacteria bacterium REEB67]
MKFGSSSSEYFDFLAASIRKSELRSAQGDKSRLAEIEASTDEYLVRRWLWTYSIVGGPVTFIAIPVLLSGLAQVAPSNVMNTLWFLSRGAMAIIFILFLVAVLTSRAKKPGSGNQ